MKIDHTGYFVCGILTNELFGFSSARSKIRDSGIFRIIRIRDLSPAREQKKKTLKKCSGKNSGIIHKIGKKS